MSTELKQAAQDAAEAIDWLLKNIRLDAPQLSGKAMGNAEKCATALLTALAQQLATACGIPGMAKTTCPYCELSFTFEHEQPATPERVPMTDEQIWLLLRDLTTNPGEMPNAWSFAQGVRDAEAHHGITAKAKKGTP